MRHRFDGLSYFLKIMNDLLMKKPKIKPFDAGFIFASVVTFIWCLGAFFIGLEDPIQFVIILVLQFSLHFAICYSCIKFGQKYGYCNPVYLFWLAHSLHHLQLYGITNLIPVCQPTKVAFASLGFVVVPARLADANYFVFLAYLSSILIFESLANKLPKSAKNPDIRTWLSSPMSVYFGITATAVLLATSIRIGPYYNSTIGQEITGNIQLFSTVSLPEKFFYLASFLLTYTPVFVLSTYTTLLPQNKRYRYLFLCLASAVISVFSFAVFRQRSYAILSVMSAYAPFLSIKFTRKIAVFLAPISIVFVYFLVTSLRFGAIDALGEKFDWSAYFTNANTDINSLTQASAVDVSYNRAGLNSITVLINLQDSGRLASRWGLQFLTEFFVGMPENIRDLIPSDLRITTEQLVSQSLGLQNIDMVEVPYLPFIHDFPWLIAPFFSVIGFLFLLFINLFIVKLMSHYYRTFGALYISYLNNIFLASSYASYSTFIKVIFPWIILLAVTRIFISYRKFTNKPSPEKKLNL